MPHQYRSPESGLFQGFTAATGWEPWIFTGNAVVMAADLAPGTASSFPYGFTELNDSVYFGATTAATGYEIFRLDADGDVTLVADLHAGVADAYPEAFTVFSGDLYVGVTTRLPADEDEVVRAELVRIDGRTGAVETVSLAGNTELDASGFTEFRNDLYFAATTADFGRELAVIDGQSGEATVIDVNPGSASSNPTNLVEFKGDLYFTATTAETGMDLFKLDGRTGSVTSLHASESEFFIALNFTEFRGDLYFSTVSELYRLDGRTGEVESLDVNLTGVVEELTVFAGGLYFTAGTPQTGTELFRLSGNGHVDVIDINTGIGSSFPSDLTVYQGKLYFMSNSAATGYELFRLDGGSSQAELVFDFSTGDSFATPLGIVDNVLAIAWTDGDAWSLASYDGRDVSLYPEARIDPFGESFTVVGEMFA